MEQNVATVAAHDLSVQGMFMAADPIVKGVMILLVLASIICWAIVLEKIVRMFILRRDIKTIENLAHVASRSRNGRRACLAHCSKPPRPRPWKVQAAGEDRSSVRGRLERAMKTALKSELQRLEAGLPFLATIGSAAPFIGLFGTVWGIMNSFTAIAHQQDTSLATVAPGIAEALFATALGLAAAIPAVMAYNHFGVKLGRAAARAQDAIVELARQLSKPATDAVKSSVEPLRAGKAY